MVNLGTYPPFFFSSPLFNGLKRQKTFTFTVGSFTELVGMLLWLVILEFDVAEGLGLGVVICSRRVSDVLVAAVVIASKTYLVFVGGYLSKFFSYHSFDLLIPIFASICECIRTQ